MARQQPAEYLAPEVLVRPDFVAACAARDLGMVLRLAKRWGGVGFSSSHLARRCGLTVSRVQDYIAGRVEARQAEVFERVADGLHIPGALLDLARRPWEEASDVGTSATTQAFETGHGRAVEPQAPTHAESLVPTDFLWTPGPADAQYLTNVRATIERLVTVDNSIGGAEISLLSEKVFEEVHKKVGSCEYEPRIRKDLLAAAGELAEVAGWIAYDANRQEAVRRMNHEALYFTRLAGDRSIELLTLQNVSMHAGFMNRPQEALDIAEMVLNGDYGLSSRLRALFLTRKARALAQGGDESSVKIFDEIQSLYLDGTRDSDPPWAWWIDERELSWHRAMCRKNLGENRQAVADFERSVDACPVGEKRRQYLHLAYLLQAQVGVRSWQAAAGTLAELLPLAREVASTRSEVLIKSTLQSLRAPEMCTPRHLVELGAQLSATSGKVDTSGN